MNNHIFFQHPDLIRILRIHKNVMAVMMNTLGRRAQAQSESQAPEAAEGVVKPPKEKVLKLGGKMYERSSVKKDYYWGIWGLCIINVL